MDVGNRASAWREAAVAEYAFRWWQNTSQADRANAAAVYLAAIEREEKAASEYRVVVSAFARPARPPRSGLWGGGEPEEHDERPVQRDELVVAQSAETLSET